MVVDSVLVHNRTLLVFSISLYLDRHVQRAEVRHMSVCAVADVVLQMTNLVDFAAPEFRAREGHASGKWTPVQLALVRRGSLDESLEVGGIILGGGRGDACLSLCARGTQAHLSTHVTLM